MTSVLSGLIMRYQPVTSSRRNIDLSLDDQAKIKPDRHIFLSAFMLCWLGGWTVGGLSAAGELHRHFNAFLLFWLGGWTLGEIAVLANLGWWWTGSETLTIVGGDLEIAYGLLGLTIRKLFKGSEIRCCRAEGVAASFRYQQASPSFLPWNAIGCVRFSYGARTVYLGADLDQTEGDEIVRWLVARLPSPA